MRRARPRAPSACAANAGRLIDRDAKVCPLCGEATGPVRARGASSTPGRIMGVIPIPTTASAVMIVANLALYAVCLVHDAEHRGGAAQWRARHGRASTARC